MFVNEIDLSFDSPPVTMSVRKLNDRPWLIEDKKKQEELKIKADLSQNPKKIVFLTRKGTEKAGLEVIALIQESKRNQIQPDSHHPLERAGLSIQEDLCLIRRHHEGWLLEAASLCFPSRWRLEDKIGKSMTDVHGPVDGYRELLDRKVNAFFDRLGPDPVWRRNWFVHPDDNLYQPERPIGGDPIIPSADVRKKLFVRSERQTLRALDLPGWILFTIRVQQTPLKNLIDTRRDELTNWLREAPKSHHRQKGLQAEQVSEILNAIT